MRGIVSVKRVTLLTCNLPYLSGVRSNCFPVNHNQQIAPIVKHEVVGKRWLRGYNKMAQILSGREVSAEVQERLRQEVASLGLKPRLAVVQVGDREDSNVYIRMKMKFAEAIGAESVLRKLSKQTTEEQLIAEINRLNNDPGVHGIIVQLPLDSDNPINQDTITNLVAPHKDVDGLSDLNAGKLFHGQVKGDTCFLPCTPSGCLELIKKSGVPVAGNHCVVVGRSKIVGSPMAQLLLWNNATVTIAHSRTRDLASIVRQADILVVAVGVPELIKGDWVKPGAVIIDCGITAVPDATKKSGQRLVGDVAYDEVKRIAKAITPVPGGVGPMTVAMLISNTVQAARNQSKK